MEVDKLLLMYCAALVGNPDGIPAGHDAHTMPLNGRRIGVSAEVDNQGVRQRNNASSKVYWCMYACTLLRRRGEAHVFKCPGPVKM